MKTDCEALQNNNTRLTSVSHLHLFTSSFLPKFLASSVGAWVQRSEPFLRPAELQLSKMGGSQSVDFGVALEKASYCAGETINGYVQVKVLTKDAKMPEHMTVSLVGNAYTAVRYTKTTGTGKNKKRVKKTARQKENLLNLVANVGNIDESQLVEGAQLQCPFAFEIPAHAASSMKVGLGLNHAEIKYQLSIYSKAPGKMFGVSTTCLHSIAVEIVSAPLQRTRRASKISLVLRAVAASLRGK